MDWPDLHEKLVETASNGPKLQIKCSRGKIGAYKKKDNIRIVAFIKSPIGELEETREEIQGSVRDFNDDDVDFDFEGNLSIPRFSNNVLRVEVRKITTNSFNGRLLIGFTEIPLNEIASMPTETYKDLQYSDKKQKRMSVINSIGHLLLTLNHDYSEVDPNFAVPKIVKEYFYRKTQDILGISENHTFDTEESLISYDICLVQNFNPAKKGSQYFYQKIVTSDGDSCEESDTSSSFVLDCIMTNKIEIGAKSGNNNRSPSPSPHNLSSARKNSLSASPAHSNSGSRRGSMVSLASIDETPKKISNFLNITTDSQNSNSDSFLNRTLNTFSPGIKSQVCGLFLLHKAIVYLFSGEDYPC